MNINIKIFTERQKILVVTILLSAAIGIIIGLLRKRGMDGSALLYIGLPTIIALTFATTTKSKSIIGSTLKTITFIILVSGPLLQEGFICMIMAAPILYMVGALAAWPFDYNRRKKAAGKETGKLNIVVLPAMLLVMSMEGVFDETSFSRLNTVEHSQIVDGTILQLKQKLGSNRPVPAPDSLFGKLFPRPGVINATGISIGDTQWVNISYFKWVFWNEMRGTTRFKVIEHQPHAITFRLNSDNNYISNYLAWGDSIVSFEPLPNNQTRVTWKINFLRKLDPAWYAEPLQRYAVGIAAKMLVTSIQ